MMSCVSVNAERVHTNDVMAIGERKTKTEGSGTANDSPTGK